MNKELAEVIKKYSTESHEELNKYLLGKSKDTLIAILNDLLTMYINDKNSSTIREFITVSLAGYEHRERKLGYNGFKQVGIDKPLLCEAKPQNISTHSEKIKKLNGGGNFTDYTWSRLEKDKNENLNMLISGFIDGRLIYILEFPFNCKEFIERIEKLLKKKFPQGDIKGSYLRSASFNFKHYEKCEDLKIVFCIKKEELKKYEKYIQKDLYKYLLENC